MIGAADLEVRAGVSGRLYPGAAGGLGSVRALVPQSMAADARAIIRESDAGRWSTARVSFRRNS